MGYGPGAENLAQLQFIMWLVAFPSWVDHAIPLSVLTGWLTHFLVFCDGICGLFFSRWPPHIFKKGDLLRISSGLEVILGYFVFTEFGLIEFSIIGFTQFGVLEFSGIFGIFFSCLLAWLEFSVLVFLDLARRCRACFRFILFYRGSRSISFLVLFGLFRFVSTWLLLRGPWCRMFFFRFK